ncbi:DUF485 domain-containing protein [Paenibacillus thermoaerophilus]|nr:DUF485 domain-containing protein [Paenibacillus thermoaerophilus]TMV16207.1 DUF485 domain-containing protein [Paenibacillus thermoaerophilus]
MGQDLQRKSGEKNAGLDYEAIAASSKFRQLISSKKKLIVPLTLLFLAFYFTLPILTSYTKILNQPAIGDISWAWLFAIAQFIMTWILCTVYVKKAASFDRLAEEVLTEFTEKGEQAK